MQTDFNPNTAIHNKCPLLSHLLMYFGNNIDFDQTVAIGAYGSNQGSYCLLS